MSRYYHYKCTYCNFPFFGRDRQCPLCNKLTSILEWKCRDCGKNFWDDTGNCPYCGGVGTPTSSEHLSDEVYQRDYDHALLDIKETKQKINTEQTLTGYQQLIEKFSQIIEVLRSLGGSFEIQTPIEECNNCRKQCEEKMRQIRKDAVLSRFAVAKEKIPNAQMAFECGNLVKEFTTIAQDFQSIFDLVEVQAQIEECNNYRKQCEEKWHQLRKDAVLSRFAAAKEKIPNAQMAYEYENFAKEFAFIAQDFESLFGSVEAQAQIEECNNYRKQCEEKKKEKDNQQKQDALIYRFGVAKSKMPNIQMVVEYDNLAKEFTAIAHEFQSLFDAVEAQAQIEECNNCHEQCKEKVKQYQKDEILSRFNIAKDGMQNKVLANEYGDLTREFASIGETLRSFAFSSELQAEIKECETLRKQFEEEWYAIRRRKETMREVPKVLRKILGVFLTILYFAITIGLLVLVFHFRNISGSDARIVIAVICGIAGAIFGYFLAAVNSGCLGVFLGIPLGLLVGGGLIGYLLVGWLLSLIVGVLWVIMAIAILGLSIFFYVIAVCDFLFGT